MPVMGVSVGMRVAVSVGVGQWGMMAKMRVGAGIMVVTQLIHHRNRTIRHILTLDHFHFGCYTTLGSKIFFKYLFSFFSAIFI